MLSPKEWSALVQHGGPADVRAALASGKATREVANSCIDYVDPCSGMLGNDLDAWVRRPALVYAVSAGKLELFKTLLGSHLVDPNETSPADQCASVARAAAFSSRLGPGGVISRCAYSADFLVEILKHPLLDVNRFDDEGSTALCVGISPAEQACLRHYCAHRPSGTAPPSTETPSPSPYCWRAPSWTLNSASFLARTERVGLRSISAPRT